MAKLTEQEQQEIIRFMEAGKAGRKNPAMAALE